MTLEQVIAAAEEAHASLPQYEGHWSTGEWFLVRFTRRVRTKMGVAFERGDVTIAHAPRYRDQWDDCPTAYSLRNEIDTSVRWSDFDRMEA